MSLNSKILGKPFLINVFFTFISIQYILCENSSFSKMICNINYIIISNITMAYVNSIPILSTKIIQVNKKLEIVVK